MRWDEGPRWHGPLKDEPLVEATREDIYVGEVAPPQAGGPPASARSNNAICLRPAQFLGGEGRTHSGYSGLRRRSCGPGCPREFGNFGEEVEVSADPGSSTFVSFIRSTTQRLADCRRPRHTDIGRQN